VQVDGDLKQRLAECQCNHCGAEGAFALVGMDFPNFGRVMCGASVGPLLAELRENGHFIDWLQTPKELARTRRRTKTLKVDDLTDRCEMCLRRSSELHPPATLAAHHVVEVQHGGEDTDENRRVYCTDCHTLIHWLRRTLGRPPAE
jgi:hypothetical protein